MFTAAELAPGDDATWRALTDPAKRPPQLRKPIPAELLTQTPTHKVQLGPAAVSAALRGAKRGGATGLSGMRAEHLRPCSRTSARSNFWRTRPPSSPMPRSLLPSSPAWHWRVSPRFKSPGGARGIATGDVFRRLVSRALAQGWADTFDQATRPYQFALKAWAGTDALAAHVRASLDMRPDAVVVSLDGRNAYDSMSRAAFLSALNSCAPELVSFVRMWYGDRPRTCGGTRQVIAERFRRVRAASRETRWPPPCTHSDSMVL